MDAYLDDRPIEADRPTLAGVLAAGAAMAEADGRIIVEVRLDGQDVPTDALERPADDDLGESEVRLVSADPNAVAAQALTDAASQLAATRARQTECAELVQTGKITEAMRLLGECIGDWQAAQSVVQSVSQLVGVAPEGAEQTIEALATRLEELKRALTGQDWATVADILAYDLDERAQQWTTMLEDMRRRVEQSA